MATNTKKTQTKKTAEKPARRIAKDTTNVNPEYTDRFIQEIDEEVKDDNLKVLWNKYGLFVILFVVLAVTSTVFFEKIKSWKEAQNQINTQNYMAAAQLQENPDETIAALQKVQQNKQGIFSDFARLQIANVLFSQEKIDEALATLQNIIVDEQVNSEVKNVATIKYATYAVDMLPREDLAKLLQPVVEAKNSWTPLAQDLLAMSAIKNGDFKEAKEIYEKILKAKDLPENFRIKIQDMLTSLGDL